jgi:hypothetical protein
LAPAVFVIQANDDRNVEFSQMVQLIEGLRKHEQGVPFEQIVVPDDGPRSDSLPKPFGGIYSNR